MGKKRGLAKYSFVLGQDEFIHETLVDKGLFIVKSGSGRIAVKAFYASEAFRASGIVEELIGKLEISSDAGEIKCLVPEACLGEVDKSLKIGKIKSKIKALSIGSEYEVLILGENSSVKLRERKVKTELESGAFPPLERKLKVLVVDDSKTIRNILKILISRSSNLEVVGEVANPLEVENKIKELQPDVMTLDINMPEMTGVEVLRKLFPKMFIPTIILSALSPNEGSEVLEALELGALDYVQKPTLEETGKLGKILEEKIIHASRQRRPVSSGKNFSGGQRLTGDMHKLDKVIVLGASTGGTEAIKSVLTKLPHQIPPILIVQHIPEVFSKAFADRLNELCPFTVKEAVNGDEVFPNQVLIAPGGRQMSIIKKGPKLVVRVEKYGLVSGHEPSVNHLFESAANILKDKAVGVILTGMGDDGAKQMMSMKQAGAYTLAQDELSCAVFGMPKMAIAEGGVVDIEPLDGIAKRLVDFCSGNYKVKKVA